MSIIIPDRLFQSGYPFNIIKSIQKEAKVSVVVNCCDSSNAFYSRDLLPETKCIYYEIIDYSIPKMDTFKLLINELLQDYNQTKNILVHCMGGRGRSSLITICLYGRIHNVGFDESIAHVRSVRGRGCPETHEQVEFIKKYFEELQG